MSDIKRIWFREPNDLKEVIGKLCDYLEKLEEKVYIENRNINGKEEEINWVSSISIDDLRNKDKIIGVIRINTKDYFFSLSNLACSYYKKK